VADHPELGEVQLNPEPLVELQVGNGSNGESGQTRVFVHPVIQPVLVRDQDLTGQAFEDQIEKDRLWKYASLRKSVEEVAKVYGISVEAFAEKIKTGFGVNWDTLSERAFLEMQFEVESNIYQRARGKDARFVLLYQKLQGLPGFYESFDFRGKRPLQIPQRVKDDLTMLSTEELQSRRAKLCAVIDRKPTFGETGQLAPTLTLRDSTPEEQAKVEPPLVPPIENRVVEAVIIPRTEEELVEPVKEVPPELPKVEERGPAIARPEPGILHLGRR
jgi:hypothetical protein